MVHLHARWPDGRPSQEAGHFREIVDRIRGGRAATWSSSAPPAARWGWRIEERLGSLVPGAEMATLNMGTMNFGDDVFVNSRPDIVRVAGPPPRAGARAGVRGLRRRHARDAGWLLEKGHLAQPYHVQFVLGVPGGMSGTERNLRFLVEGLPEAVHWSVAGIGRFELPMAELSLRLGGHVRVGLEDNLYLSKGVLASGNDQLVSAAAALAARAGRRLATPAEARVLLGIKRIEPSVNGRALRIVA